MSRSLALDGSAIESVLLWAAQRHVPLSVSILKEGSWRILRSFLAGFDPVAKVIRISYPVVPEAATPPEIAAGDELGIAFRRGHKKCAFVTTVLLRQLDRPVGASPVDTLVIRCPDRLRDLQRRCYQRFIIPPSRFVPVRLWQGGLARTGEPTWPICSGRVANISLGGLLVDIRAEHNPRLSIGDGVGVEITHDPGQPPLSVDAQYRHCVATGEGRMGLGLQFVGLEHDRPGRTDIAALAEFIKSLRAAGARIDPEE